MSRIWCHVRGNAGCLITGLSSVLVLGELFEAGMPSFLCQKEHTCWDFNVFLFTSSVVVLSLQCCTAL